jgi:hypothetical protein
MPHGKEGLRDDGAFGTDHDAARDAPGQALRAKPGL